MTGLDWTMILAYFALLAGVVVFTMKRKKIETEKDLFLGGRSVGWLAIGASIFAANIGSEPTTPASPRCRSSLNEGSGRRPGGFCH